MPSSSTRHPLVRSAAAGLLTLLVALAIAVPVRAAQRGWPRQIDFSGGSLVIYQPQPESLRGDTLTGRAAFSLQKSSQANPIFGVVWFTERIAIDRDSSTVAPRGLDITKVRLPRTAEAEANQYGTLIETEAATWDFSGTLTELRAGLAASEKERTSVEGLDNQPPRIIFAYERAILVAYDGAPLLAPVEGTKLQQVTNTPFVVILDPADGTYYLCGANVWYAARDPLGPWTDLPDSSAVPAVVRAVVPADTSAEAQVRGTPPVVLTAEEPTELIATDGPPRYQPLVGDELLYVTNTESDVLLEVESQALYVLLAGRWFTAASTDGPWSYVTADSLPECFRRIPSGSVKGYLLASVAGTDEADDAVADAQIPQTAAIRRDTAGLEVSYDGDPDFEPIEGTDLRYAVNADIEIILADGRYYACDQGVWYIADDPYGPWVVSETRPIGLEDVPPACPVYHLRYVYVFDWTDDVVYMGYLPGYIGCYPYDGTVVFGTGHRYRPWRGHHRYHPWPVTWGYGPRYNPWMSRWSFSFSWNTGFLRIGMRWHSGRAFARRHGPPLWFGPGGYRRPLFAADRSLLRPQLAVAVPSAPRDRQPVNIYNRPENAIRVDYKAKLALVREVTRTKTRIVSLPNDVFAGRDGRVYQRDARGNWKVNDGGSWRTTTLPRAVEGGPAAGGRAATGDARRGAAPQPGVTPSPTRPVGGVTTQPVERRSEPTTAAPPAPQTPARRPEPATPQNERAAPGDLEREYRARERSAAPAPQPAPAAPEREAGPARQPAQQREAAPAPQPAPKREERPRGGSPAGR